MSEAERYDSVRISAEGVRVVKRFAADRFPVPAIAFEISSGRDETVDLRLSDRVPDGVAVDDLGFHPDYGSEFWTIEEDRITFEKELEADASYTTVYGIRAADDVGQFLTEPTIENVDPPLPESEQESEVVLESDDALVEDAITADVEPDESEETTEDPDVPSTLNLEGPGEESNDETAAVPGNIAEPNVAAESESEAAALPEDGSLVATLATELRERDVPEEDLDLLREVLVEETEAPSSTAARLDQLQQDVARLRSYTNAIEEFLDENGTAEQLIGSFEQEIDDFQTEIESFGDRIEHLETEFVVDIRGRIESLEDEFEQLRSDVTDDIDRIDDIEQRTAEVAERADDAQARTTELVGRLDDIETELAELDRLDDIEAELERIDDIEAELDRIGDIEAELDRIDDIEAELDRIDDIEGEVDRIDDIEAELDRIDDIEAELDRIDDIEAEVDRIDDIEELVNDIQSWREQLIQSLGG